MALGERTGTGMRIQLVVLLVILTGVAFLGGATRPGNAGASPNRALACTAPGSYCHVHIEANQSGGTVRIDYSGPSSGNWGTFACTPVCRDENWTWNYVLTLTATPPEHYRFAGWSGPCSGTGTCVFTITDNRDARASWERIRRTVTIQRSGSGTVTSEPARINCGTTCSAEFDEGEQVAFVATPIGGAQFNGWGGACASAVRNTRCIITIPNNDVTITASFGPPPVPVTVTKSGRGTVTSVPAGINCGSACSANFPSGSQVTLTATPEPEYPFQGWAGACTGTALTCTFTPTTATSVSARFSSGKVDELAAGFRGSWRRSVYNGSLVLRGTATADLQLTARIASESVAGLRSPESRLIERTFEFSVPSGAFEKLFPLPNTGFYPGRYTVSLTGTSGGAPTISRSTPARMEPPGEGIVSRAWVTAGGARAVTRARRGTKRLVAHFTYVTKPFRGSKVTVSWSLGKRALGTVKKVRWKPIVVTDVASAAGLPSGRYTCVLKARGLVVYEVNVRIG
jgi:List-Bact-rpt repeat protein